MVAYGTNNWFGNTLEEFREKCFAFYRNLADNYPNSKIFAFTPLWHVDCRDDRKFGPFEGVEEGIRDAVRDMPNVTVIPGFDLIPHDKNYYGDFWVHPSDEGFGYYYENLSKVIFGKKDSDT